MRNTCVKLFWIWTIGSGFFNISRGIVRQTCGVSIGSDKMYVFGLLLGRFVSVINFVLVESVLGPDLTEGSVSIMANTGVEAWQKWWRGCMGRR